ncbi:MAG: rod shape-determining protein MreC [Parachlamydia sp.]|nr:rod shape-determining protein MreC [Parachlamydia sp.]
MRKKFAYTYLFIILLLLVTMGLSRKTSDKMRGRTATLLAPFWEMVLQAKHKVVHPFQPSPSLERLTLEEEINKLELENQLLLQDNKSLLEQLHGKAFYKAVIPGRVLFRTMDSWNRSLWINVGEEENVALHSPVLSEGALIGMIDYVGKKQSRVRLITDPRLTLSVRALRGGEQEVLIAEQAEMLQHQLKRKGKGASRIDFEPLIAQLEELKSHLQGIKKTWYLAKGEIRGSNELSLKGTGFNYDFPDEKGGPYDLREGFHLPKQGAAIPLVKVHDILVTTGLDGIFPEGLRVARVEKILPLKEGDYFFELEAAPLSSHIEGLSLVFVLPPTGLDIHEAKYNRSL